MHWFIRGVVSEPELSRFVVLGEQVIESLGAEARGYEARYYEQAAVA